MFLGSTSRNEDRDERVVHDPLVGAVYQLIKPPSVTMVAPPIRCVAVPPFAHHEVVAQRNVQLDQARFQRQIASTRAKKMTPNVEDTADWEQAFKVRGASKHELDSRAASLVRLEERIATTCGGPMKAAVGGQRMRQSNR